MNAAAETRVALFGLQAAGKTTYVVALFQACNLGKDDLKITRYGQGQREYLNALSERLAARKSLERTNQTEPGELRLYVRLVSDADEVQLVIPDLSGEHLRDGMTSRMLTEDLADLATDADAALLFVRVDKVESAETLADFNLLMRGLDAVGEDIAPERPEDWEVEFAPTQVRLTDAMQELLRLRGVRPLRVALVLSAWDQVHDLAPEAWARKHLGLLSQLLDGHPLVEWTAFGVSAQGGDFQDEEDLKRLEKKSLSARPFVDEADGSRVGIGAPVKWVLGVGS
jgi:hypothetical protein